MKFLTERNIYILISGFIFIYLVTRAITIPLYFDELQTLNSFVKTGYLSPYNEYRAANNHLVNTYLTSISYHVFGESPLSLRLFNLISFIPFSIYIFLLGKHLKSGFTRWAFFIGLLFSLNIIAFFSLSRGYGLSLCFMIMTIYYLYNTFFRKEIKNIVLCVIFMLLGLFSNFSLLLFVLISLGIIIINVMRHWDYYKQLKQILLLSFLAILIFISLKFTLDLLFYYKEEGELWWGNLDGFIRTTLQSLAGFIFEKADSEFILQGSSIAMTVVLTLIFIFKDSLLKKYNETNLFFALIILNILGIIVMAEFLEVNYPYQRTGMHLYVLFVGAFCFGIDRLRMTALKILLLLPLVYIPFHFFNHLNLSYVSNWETDNVPVEYIEKVESLESSQNNNYNASIYIQGMGFASWNHHVFNKRRNMPLALFSDKDPGKFYDYLIVNSQIIEPIKSNYNKLKCTPHTDLCLYKRKFDPQRILIDQNISKKKQSIDAEFNDLIRINIDSLISSSLFLNLNCSLQHDKFPFQTHLVYTVINRETKEQIMYESLALDNRDWSNSGEISLGRYILNLPENKPLEIIVYLYNSKHLNYSLNGFDVKIYQVKD